MLTAYVERTVRFGFGLLAAALLLAALLQAPPGATIDPGISLQTKRPVAELISPALPFTLKAFAVSVAAALPLALLLGVPAGLRPHTIVDRLLQAPAVALMGVPAFGLSLLAIYSLALRGQALSLEGAARVGVVLTLAAWLARAVRNGLADSRTDGAQVPWGKAALLVLGRVLQQMGNLLTVTMLVEITSTRPGMGMAGLLLQGAMARDLPVVYGVLWPLIAIVLLGHLAGDLLVTVVGGDREAAGGRISRSWLVLGWLLAALLLVLPWLGGGKSPEVLDIMSRMQPPGPEHLLGTDHLGRDVLSRASAGARTSLTVAGAATLLGLLPAAFLATAGWAMGRWGMAILTPRTAVPSLFGPMVAGLLGALIFKPSLSILVLCLGLAAIPALTRAFRQLYQDGRTVAPVRRAVPALLGVIILVFAQNLLVESILSYLGFGVLPPLASLGSLISPAIAYLRTAPHLLWALLPGAAGIAGLLLVGYGLADPGRERL